VALQDGQHDQRVASSRFGEAVEELEGVLGLAPVDGVCEVPGRHRTGLAEVGFQFLRADPGAGAISGLQHGQQGGQAVEVLAQVGLDQRGGRRRQTHRRMGQAVGHPPWASLLLTSVDMTSAAGDCLKAATNLAGNCPPPPATTSLVVGRGSSR